ncbi:AAA family ATPase, partial [Chloroflexota bacterium]
MTINGNNKFNIRTGLDLVTSSVPDIPYRIIGLLRANGGRLSLTGQYKSEKSLLAQEMAMRMAKGDDWLGFKTIPGNVLYANLEISNEKFQERTQDFYSSLGYDTRNLSNFNSMTILD